MRIIAPRSVSDIVACVEMYYNLNDHSFIEISKEESVKNLLRFSRQKEFVRMLLNDNDEIIAWIFASKAKPYHSAEIIFQQFYYASNQKGLKAFRSVILLHEEMIEEAARLDLKVVLSSGSHLDDDFTFARILEKSGWQRRGYLASKRLS